MTPEQEIRERVRLAHTYLLRGVSEQRKVAEEDRVFLLAALDAERERSAKLEEERDLAIAHDRQPYPTADAYEALAKAHAKARERIAKLERALKEECERMRCSVVPGSLKCKAAVCFPTRQAALAALEVSDDCTCGADLYHMETGGDRPHRDGCAFLKASDD